jgi:isoleucyl-tRNA synthetase
VALDIEISEELREEGLARELVNRVQKLRKDSGLEVTDRIVLSIEPVEALEPVLARHKEYICREILASKLLIGSDLELPESVEIDGLEVRMRIQVAQPDLL